MTSPGGGANLGTARGKLVIDNSQANKSLKETETAAESFRKGATKAGSGGAEALGAVGRTATLMGVAVAGGLALAVNSAASFEQRLSGIQAVSGATGAEMEGVRKKALQLGKDTKFSAGEAAQAIEELAKAGISLPDILNGAADATVALAAAGEIDLPQAATIASNAMNGFGLSAQQMPHIADLIAGAANASAIDVSEFGQSLQQSGAAAHLAGLSFDDLATAIALMGNAGIKGSDAGTSLKTMLLNLNPQTKKQINLMKDLGIITKDGANSFFDAAGKTKSLAQISEILHKALKNQTKQQQLATLETIFGSDAIRAAAVLAGQGAAGFDKMSKSMGKVKAADVAAARMNNLKGNIEQLKGSLETAGIVIGSVFLPILTTLVKSITALFNAFLNLSPEVQKTIGIVAAAAAAFLLVFGTLLKVISIAKAVGGALSAAFAANPVVLIIAAIVAAIAAVVILYQRFQGVRNVVDSVFTFVRKVLDGAVAGVKALVAAFKDGSAGISSSGFIGVMQKIGLAARTLFDFFMTTLLPAIKQLVAVVSGAFTTIWAAVLKAIQPLVQAFKDNQTQIMVLVKAIGTIILFFIKLQVVILFLIESAVFKLALVAIPLLAKWISFLVQAIGLWVAAIITAVGWIVRIGTVAVQVFTAIWTVVGPLVRAIAALIGSVFMLAYTLVAGSVRLTLAIVTTIWRLIYNVIATYVRLVFTIISTVWNLIAPLVNGIFNRVLGVARAVWSGITAAVRVAVGAVKSAISGLTSIIGQVRGFFEGARRAAQGAINGLLGIVRAVPGQIRAGLSGLGSLLISAGEDLIRGLVKGIQNMAGAAISAAKSIASSAVGAVKGALHIGSPSKVFEDIGVDTIQGFINGVVDMRRDALDAVSGVAGAVGPTARGVLVPPTDAASRASVAVVGPAVVIPPFDAKAVADAMEQALIGARFEFGADGLARLVTRRITNVMQAGAKA